MRILAARVLRRIPALSCALLLVIPLALTAQAETLELGKPVVMRGAAVAQTPNGFVGSTATFTITAAQHGSGHVFLDTFPLTEVDMQGSARLAARVAAQVSGKNLNDYDLFFVIRSGSMQIGGPSAGATLTVGAIAAMNGWDVRPDVLDTGTIQPDGSIGPVGGIPEKAAAAAQAGIKTFLFPEGEETQPLSAQPGTTVDVATYCRQELSIRCAPVSDIYQLIENMTDHTFPRQPIAGDVTG
ncbi:MAG: S16 family serine protease, partial [Candidatus Thermoplasmatota archaeon]